MTLRTRASQAVLFLIGFVVGAGLFLYKEGGSMRFFSFSAMTNPGAHEADACTKSSQDDAVFFVSCGGIY